MVHSLNKKTSGLMVHLYMDHEGCGATNSNDSRGDEMTKFIYHIIFISS